MKKIQFLKKEKRINLKKAVTGVLISFLFMNVFADENISVYSSQFTIHEAFVLFYLSHCIHCKRFEPILKKYAQSHQMPILAYALDGETLGGFSPGIFPSPQEMNQFFPNHNPVAPALFLMDLDRHTIKPVLQGEATKYQLESRIEELHDQGMSDEN